jgi:anti-sigma factor RsiW
MDCREFREKHVGFVDDVLPAVEMEVMHRHLQSCPRCARHDIAVRRGLLLVRNIPRIEPSPDFMARLNDRIAKLKLAGDESEVPPPYRLTTGAFAALAAGLTLFAYVALEAMNRFAEPQTLTLPPVVATAPARPAPSFTSTAYMAGISTGMPVWPAVLMADEAPRHLADVELQQASLR